jgi:hypothetical protein
MSRKFLKKSYSFVSSVRQEVLIRLHSYPECMELTINKGKSELLTGQFGLVVSCVNSGKRPVNAKR